MFQSDAVVRLPETRVCYLNTVGDRSCNGYFELHDVVHQTSLQGIVVRFGQRECVTPIVVLFSAPFYLESIREVSPPGPTLCLTVNPDRTIDYG